jgi:hypothetical protein
MFQAELRNIKSWSRERIEEELKMFKTVSQCTYLEKLVLSIFKTYYLLNNLRNVEYPDVEDYIHECYLNIARKLWKNPFLMYDEGFFISVAEKRRNMNAVEDVIQKCIQYTFVQMLPFSIIDYDETLNSDDGA